VISYLVRRILWIIPVLFTVSIITFILMHAVPGGPWDREKPLPASVEARLNAEYGLDKPLYEQYATFVKGIVAGRTYGSGTATFECSVPCLGYSFDRGEEVSTLIKDTLPVTAQLALGAFVLWILAGVSVGIVAALKRGKWQDRTIMGLALAGYSFPSFFIGLLLIFFVQIKWGLIGFEGYVPIYEDPSAWFTGFILPWTALALLYAAFYARLTRNQMLETLGEDYIRTARAKGLRERRVIGRHALRAGLTPIVTAAGLDLATLLGGAVITEGVFNLPGMGRLAIESVTDADLPIITATVLVASAFIILANLVVDILYAVIDPRVRLA